MGINADNTANRNYLPSAFLGGEGSCESQRAGTNTSGPQPYFHAQNEEFCLDICSIRASAKQSKSPNRPPKVMNWPCLSGAARVALSGLPFASLESASVTRSRWKQGSETALTNPTGKSCWRIYDLHERRLDKRVDARLTGDKDLGQIERHAIWSTEHVACICFVNLRFRRPINL